MKTAVSGRLTIEASTRTEANERINASVEHLKRIAMTDKTRGILVTRRDAGRFTIELSEDVPYGLTLEAHDENGAS